MPTINPQITDVLTTARDKAAEPVRVPWRAPLTGFVVGFLLAVVPAAFVTRVLASQLPFGEAVVHGDTAMAFAVVLAVVVGLATAVCRAARPGS